MIARRRARATRALRIVDRLAIAKADIQTALREQIFDVAIAERETEIEPDGVPDDRRRELVAGERDRHPPSYPSN